VFGFGLRLGLGLAFGLGLGLGLGLGFCLGQGLGLGSKTSMETLPPPSILLNQKHEDYLKAPGVSQSSLKLIKKCPALFKYRSTMRSESHSTEAMSFGKMFHEYLLTRRDFKKSAYIAKKITRRGKAWDGLVERAASKEVIFKRDNGSGFDCMFHMKQSIMRNQRASKLLEKSSKEVSIFWQTNGIKCKGRLDGIAKFGKGSAIFDIKTAADASPNAFNRTIFSSGYHIQAAYYLDGYEAATATRPAFFIIIAVEKTPPFLCALYIMKNDSDPIQLGRREYLDLLATYKSCEENNSWPSFDEPLSVYVPAWYKQ
jgi:exodeoxyribonuclease VIII